MRREFDAFPIRDVDKVAIFAGTVRLPAIVRSADVASCPLILEYHRVNENRLTRAWLKDGGVEVKPALQFDRIEPIKDAVASGLGMAIVPCPALGRGQAIGSIVARPLDPPLTRTLGLIQRRDRRERLRARRRPARHLLKLGECARRSRLTSKAIRAGQ